MPLSFMLSRFSFLRKIFPKFWAKPNFKEQIDYYLSLNIVLFL